MEPERSPRRATSPDELRGNPETLAAVERKQSGDNRSNSRESGNDDAPRRNGRRSSRSRSGSVDSRRRDHHRRQRSSSEPRQRRDDKSVARPSQIYVKGISRSIVAEDLKEAFEQYGPIRDIVMKGVYAFIEFVDPKDADVAIAKMDKQTLKGHELTVEKTRKIRLISFCLGEKGVAGTRGARSGPGRNDECWNCGKTGHWANECRSGRGRHMDRDRDGGRYRRRSDSRDRRRSPPRGRRSSRSDSRDIDRREGRCFGCQERGHIRANCPNNPSRGRDTRFVERRRDDRMPINRGYDSRDGPRRRNSSRSRSPLPPIRDLRAPRRDYESPRDSPRGR